MIYHKQVIGFGSPEHGTGTTCISLSVANFLYSKERKKTAYLELNPSNQIHFLGTYANNHAFTYFGITLFPNVTLSSLPQILEQDYEYFILDMGILNPNTALTFSQCDKQFIIGSLSLLKQQSVIQKIETLLKTPPIHKESVTILGNPGIKESNSAIFSKSFAKIIDVPFIENPFQIASDNFGFYKNLLERN
ncbi:MAG: hypothetical protein IKJ01_00300 [Lachnospiraceae bacterium]|nr:hypothetical protein [Lachnospiraceae bacterium]